MNSHAVLLRISLTLVLWPPLGLADLAQAQSAPGAVPDVSGDWQLTCTSRRGREREVTLHIQQDGAKLSGSASSNGHVGPISGSIQGMQVSISGGGDRAFSFGGALSGNAMSGQNQSGRSCSAKRR